MSFDENQVPERIPADPVAMTALLVALSGFPATALVRDRIGSSILGMILGSAGCGLLALLFTKMAYEVGRQTQGMLQLRFEIGFWLALVGFLAAAGTSFLRLRTREPAPPATSLAETSDASGGA